MRFPQELVEFLPDIVYLIDTEGNLLNWNRVLEDVTGYTADEIEGKPALDFFVPEDRPVAQAAIQEAFLYGYKKEQLTLLCKDGTRIPYEYDGVPFKDENGQVQGLTGVGRDISQLKEAWSTIERLAAFPRENPNPVLEITRHGDIAYQNRSAWTLLHKLKKQDFFDVFPDSIQTIIHHCLDSGRSQTDLETDIGTRVLSLSFHPLPSNDLVHCYVTDVTEKKQMEKRLLRSQRLESLGNLAAGIVHDMNNVFAPIKMAANLLPHYVDNERGHKLLNRINTAIDRGSGMLRELLTFAKGEAGEKTPLDIRKLLKGLQDTTLEVFPPNIHCEASIASDLHSVIGDMTQLHQVLTNLCLNARDAMPNGGTLRLKAANVRIEKRHENLAPGDYVLVQVEDTGHGISPEHRDQIFDPFFTTKGPSEGTGLGLSTSQGIVRSHGGSLTFETELNQGTHFKVFLPAAPDSEGQPAPPEAPTGKSGQGQTILVIDDEEDVRETLRDLLTHYGYECLTASDGREAMRLFSTRQNEIDLVLTDLFMPHMDGTELVRSLKATRPDLPIIALSGYLSAQSVNDLRRRNVTQYLSKPVGKGQLLEVLDDALSSTPSWEA